MYEKKISTSSPGLIVFVLDDSGSTGDNFPGTTDPVYKWIERYCGIILKELLARSTEIQGEDAKIKPRYHISVIVYGSSPKFRGDPIMDIETAIQRYSDANNSLGLGGYLGGTDAEAAFKKAFKTLKETIADKRFCDSFPPIIFHLTDGLSSTDATPVAQKLQSLSTSDGQSLIVNAFIGTETSLSYKDPEDFPGYTTCDQAGPSDDNIRLFNMSSPMPDCMCDNLRDDGIFPALSDGSRLFFDVRTKEMLKHVIQVVGSIGSRANRTER